MIEIQGKYAYAKIFTNLADADTLKQVYELLNQEALRGATVRVMPDCHAGKGCVVGTTITIQDSVIPNLVGIDIGCGMLAVRLKDKAVDLPGFDNLIREYIPSGGNVHDRPIRPEFDLSRLCCYKKARLREALAQKSIGTLGGGNHFIEVGHDSANDLWLVVHSGSRHLGIEVCNYYQKQALVDMRDRYKADVIDPEQARIIHELKTAGRSNEIPDAVKKLVRKLEAWTPGIPADLAPCTGSLMEDYIHDMQVVQEFAKINRRTIADLALQYVCDEVESFDTVHNYVDGRDRILRKGAIAAYEGQRVLIPINMRDGSLVCTGKSNPDWNFSAPHGAGRLFSRSGAKERFTLEEFAETMAKAGIYTTSIGESTLSECPMAYKPVEAIVGAIQDTVDVVDVIRPIYNFKA